MQTYHITDILSTPAHTSLHVGIFEETPDPEGMLLMTIYAGFLAAINGMNSLLTSGVLDDLG
ncbi:hypothetical protein RCZ04_05420 [Capnocytophaga sp. HP1101]